MPSVVLAPCLPALPASTLRKGLTLPLSFFTLYYYSLFFFSHRQISVAPAGAEARPVDGHADVGPDDGQVAGEAGDGAEEVAKQHQDAVQLDQEADQRPPQQDQQQPAEEGRRALDLLPPREEERRLLRADDNGQSDEEEDLFRGYFFSRFDHSCW